MKSDALACFGAIIISGTLLVTSKATAEAEGEGSLGHFPLCEASSALILACPDGKGDCLIVGDNEQRNDLFLFHLKDEAVDTRNQKALSLQLSDDDALSDIEAMAPMSADTILVFGSHSRNTKCEAKKKRRRFAEVKLSGDGAEVVRQVQSRKIKCDRLFGQISSDNEVLKAACDAIDRAEEGAKKIEGELENQLLTKKQAKKRCNEIVPFNAEGAVAISAAGGTEFWLGLRAPLLAEHPSQPERKKLAMLLRMKGLEAYKFDKVALLDLGGRGIRELSVADDRVWLIAGPAEDKQEPFELRSFPKDAINSAEIIEPELVKTLPISSEGLAIKGGLAYVVIDGDKGDDEAAQHCKTPSSYKMVSLPQLAAKDTPFRAGEPLQVSESEALSVP